MLRWDTKLDRDIWEWGGELEVVRNLLVVYEAALELATIWPSVGSLPIEQVLYKHSLEGMRSNKHDHGASIYGFGIDSKLCSHSSSIVWPTTNRVFDSSAIF